MLPLHYESKLIISLKQYNYEATIFIKAKLDYCCGSKSEPAKIKGCFDALVRLDRSKSSGKFFSLVQNVPFRFSIKAI